MTGGRQSHSLVTARSRAVSTGLPVAEFVPTASDAGFTLQPAQAFAETKVIPGVRLSLVLRMSMNPVRVNQSFSSSHAP